MDDGGPLGKLTSALEGQPRQKISKPSRTQRQSQESGYGSSFSYSPMSSNVPYSPSSCPPPKSPWFPATPGTPGYPGTPSFMGPRTPVSPEQLLPRNSPQTPRTPSRLAWNSENYSDVESEVGDCPPHSVSSTCYDFVEAFNPNQSITFHSSVDQIENNRSNAEAAAPSDDNIRDPVFSHPSPPVVVSNQLESTGISDPVQSSGQRGGNTPEEVTGHNGSQTWSPEVDDFAVEAASFEFTGKEWSDFVDTLARSNGPSGSPTRSVNVDGHRPFMSPPAGETPFIPNGHQPYLEAQSPIFPNNNPGPPASSVRAFMSLDGFRCKTKAWVDAFAANHLKSSSEILFRDLFTEEEMINSNLRGKGGSEKLDSRRLTAIIRAVSWILYSHKHGQINAWLYNCLEVAPPLSGAEIALIENVFSQHRWQLAAQAKNALGRVPVARKRKALSTS